MGHQITILRIQACRLFPQNIFVFTRKVGPITWQGYIIRYRQNNTYRETIRYMMK